MVVLNHAKFHPQTSLFQIASVLCPFSMYCIRYLFKSGSCTLQHVRFHMYSLNTFATIVVHVLKNVKDCGRCEMWMHVNVDIQVTI